MFKLFSLVLSIMLYARNSKLGSSLSTLAQMGRESLTFQDTVSADNPCLIILQCSICHTKSSRLTELMQLRHL